MDHNQLVADFTIRERCVCECMIVSCFDFGGYGPCCVRCRMVFSDEWTIWRVWEKNIAKMKFSLLVPIFKYHKIVNRIGIFHVNFPFVGLTLVPWGHASENDLGWSLGIPECHKFRNCYCCITFVSCEQWLQVMIALCICVLYKALSIF